LKTGDTLGNALSVGPDEIFIRGSPLNGTGNSNVNENLSPVPRHDPGMGYEGTVEQAVSGVF